MIPTLETEIYALVHRLVAQGVGRFEIGDALVRVGINEIERGALHPGLAVERWGNLTGEMAERTGRMARDVEAAQTRARQGGRTR